MALSKSKPDIKPCHGPLSQSEKKLVPFPKEKKGAPFTLSMYFNPVQPG